MIETKTLRDKFIQYFQKKGHTLVPSSSVIPHEDPTLLFTNAGMNQFKDVFLGMATRDYTRAVTAQKCIRVGGKHNDLDNVGHTSRHMTFFEMLGNFSFGDYFKKEAIRFAFEVATEIFELPLEQIWISVFEKDEEAFALWSEYIHPDKIVRIGKKDNFWQMGDTGPCGPCSELFIDRGPSFSDAPTPKEDEEGERFLEFWNLVFMEMNQDASGKFSPLPNKSIDTGLGLERLVAIKNGYESVFQTDILQHLIRQVEHLTNRTYDAQDHKYAAAFHVIADHLRTLAFAIADGAQPSNIERGYVLRKVLRRAVRYGRLLGLQKPFLAQMYPALEEVMGQDYVELQAAKTRIQELLTLEEESFLHTLKRGGNLLNQIIEKAEGRKAKEISGEDAFKLKDTYGLPLEEILLLAKDAGLTVNLETYQLLEEKAKERSRKGKSQISQEAKENLFAPFAEKHNPTQFLGYETDQEEGTIIGLLHKGQFVKQLTKGEEGVVILDQTPFYPEKGGQVGDQGMLSHQKASFVVQDCQMPYPGVITHVGKVQSGLLLLGEPLQAMIDTKRRRRIECNHTATHLMHYALQQVLGDHIRQAGSLVEEHRLRFDFNHHKALTFEEIREIETMVNHCIHAHDEVTTYETPYQEIQKDPSIKQFFGEKYGKTVRVVQVGNYSKELCGGTHVSNIKNIGLFKITQEMSIAKGVRRLVATTGLHAIESLFHLEDTLYHLASELNVPIAKLVPTLTHLLKEHARQKEEIKSFQKEKQKALKEKLLTQSETICDIPVLTSEVALSSKELAPFANELMQAFQKGAFCLASVTDDKVQLLIKVGQPLIDKGCYAKDLIKQISPLIEGGGGGKKESAQAGGKNPGKLPEVFAQFKQLIREKC